MTEPSRQESEECSWNQKNASSCQRGPWYLQGHDGGHPFNNETSHVRPHVFQNIPAEVPHCSSANLPDRHNTSQYGYDADDASHSQVTDHTRERAGSSVRPGTPALPQTSFDGSYEEVHLQSNIMNSQCNYGVRHQEIATSMNRILPEKRPLDLCQQETLPPPQICSLFAGTVARTLDVGLLERHPQPEICFSNSVRSSSNHHQQRNIRQIVAERPTHSYRFDHQVQQLHSLNSLSDLGGNPPVNCNFNHLHANMVRLKNGSNPEDKDDQYNVPNGDQYLEDGEGNHECHDLRQNPAETDGDQERTSVSHLPVTPTVGKIDVNQFAAFGASMNQGDWPATRALWMSGPSSIGEVDSLSGLVGDDTESIMSFSSSTAIASSRHSHPHQLGAKVEMVYSLLSMLGSSNRDDMSKTLLEMSNSRESCVAMRQSGCLPLLVQLLHGTDHDYLLSDQDPNSLRWALREARRRAGQALHNIVYAHPDDKRGRREARVLRLLEQIRDYSDYLKDVGSGAADITQNENLDFHPGPAIAALMKLSFDEEHRHAMCLLGGLQAIAELIQADHEVHGNTNDQFCITVRRYAGMALTNLTFGDGTNKALLCSMKPFMQALVAQLHSPNEDLRQVTASVLRNLSWRADAASKQILREVDAVVTLMKTAMETSKESTLKSILSALWNLSAHCSVNKADICAIEGALVFLVSTLTYKSSSKTLSIVENGGGILRNISSHIAVREDYRSVLRKHNCLQTLLRHLKSPSLTVVSNACGTLWNLSARCQQDQQALWEMGAVGMLRNLIHSKHKMISMGSAAALKNLLAARPPGMGLGLSGYMENGHHSNGGSQNGSPSLLVRKQRALEADIDQNLSETCDNIDSPKTSPNPSTNKKFTFESNGVNKPQYLSYLPGRMYHSINGHVTSPLYVPRSESRDSLGSTRSEPPHYRAQCERFRIFVNTNRHLPLDPRTVQERPSEWKEKTNLEPEDNTSIVMQLFQSLHSNSATSGNVCNPSSIHISGVSNKPARANNLTPVKRGAWEIPSREVNLVENRNIPLQNGFIYADDSNPELPHAYLNGKSSLNSEFRSVNISPRHSLSNEIKEGSNLEPGPAYPDAKSFCDFPDNKRPAGKGQLIHSTPLQNGHSSSPDIIYRKTHDAVKPGPSLPESSKLYKNPMDPIQENVVLRKKAKCDISHWSSTSTLKEPDSEEVSVDHTPLAISRCSSLSSLASCMPPSARNSWISDVSSRRTSGVISPNDIPDSPCDTKPRMSQFTDKAPDAETLGIPRPRPAWPSSISSTISNDSLSSSNKYLSSETDLSPKTSEFRLICKGPELVSVISMDGDNLDGKCALKSPPERPPNTPERDLYLSSSSSSLENEDIPLKEQELLAACIDLGMPNNSSCSTQHNNNSKLHSRVNNLSSSFSYMRSGIPVKSNNVRLTQSVPNVTRPQVLSSCAVGPVIPEMEGTAADASILSSGPRLAHLDPVCDDNDNLLYQNLERKQESDLQFATHNETPPKGLKQHNAELACETSEASKKYLPVAHSFSHREKNERYLNVESEDVSHMFKDQMHSAQVPSPSSEDANSSFPSSSSQARSRSSRKPKTSIPQIVRPWHPGLDNEVHPKQLQIMSQNLPVYRGTFAIHHCDNDERKDDHDECEGAVGENVRRQSDPSSSISADSEVSSAELLQDGLATGKPPRAKAKRNKLFRRSTEIITPDHSSDEDNRNNISEGHILLDQIPPVQYSEEEEKGKEDERTKEKYKELLVINSAIPDLLEGATFHADIAAKKGIEGRPLIGVKVNGLPKVMTDSMELKKGAFMVAAELEELADDQTHSSASCFSDLDNIKPPSVMGEMSMTSSGLSDLLSNGNGKCYINGKTSVDRRRSLKRIKKVNGSQRFVFKSVLQARDVTRSVEHGDKASSAADSVENLSMKSSGTSELLDNINPPSVMEDISMTNSCTSLNSINSDILESRSQSLADPRSDSEMFQRLNAAAAMVQVYSRELSNIMTGSMKSSCNSDNLDQVKPPSVFQDIAEVTVEDGTEVGSDAMISDSELEEEELPHDDEGSIPSTDTVHSPLHLLTRTEQYEECSENLNSSFEGDSICTTEKTHQSVKRISGLALTPQSTSIINMDSNTVQHTACSVIENTSSTVEDVSTDAMNESNGTAGEHVGSPSPGRRGPRIVKPINRETIRQMQEKKALEKPVRSVRGRAAQSSRNLLRNNISRTNTSIKTTNTRKSTVVSAVRPTRTSALRASQSQKQADYRSTGGRVSPRTFLSKPPVPKSAPRSIISGSSSAGAGPKVSSEPTADKCQTTENQKPSPPVKQGTFTKDEPTQKAPAISPLSPHPQKCLTDNPISQCEPLPVGQTVNARDAVGSDSQTSQQSGTPNGISANKITNKKSTSNDSSSVKRSSSNYGLKRNVSLPLQKKENSKSGLKPSPSSHSFGDGHDGGKSSVSTNSRSATFSRNGLSSTTSSLKRASSQKEVTSKISSIWKKSESSSSANSPVTDNSVTERISAAAAAGKAKQVPSKPTPLPNRFLNSATSSSQGSSTHSSASDRSEKLKSDASTTSTKTSQKTVSSNGRVVGSLVIRQNNVSGVRKKVTLTKAQPTIQGKQVSKAGNYNGSFITPRASVNNDTQQIGILSHRNVTKAHSSTGETSVSHPLSVTSHNESYVSGKTASSSEVKTSPTSAVVPPFKFQSSSSRDRDTQNKTYEHQPETRDDDSENSESHTEKHGPMMSS